jgi:hypothetical protein
MWPFTRKKATVLPPGPPAGAPYPYGGLPDTLPGGWTMPGYDSHGGLFNANEFPGAWPLGIPNVDSRGVLDQTGQLQPLPATLAAQLTSSNTTRYRQFTGHSFIQARLPDPGAPAWTFDALGLVEFSPIGPGILNQGEILALEGAPLFPTQGVFVQGLGGIVQGELVLQPLVQAPNKTADLQVG